MFKVMLERRIGSVHSTIEVDVRAENQDAAVAVAESELTGWKTMQVLYLGNSFGDHLR